MANKRNIQLFCKRYNFSFFQSKIQLRIRPHPSRPSLIDRIIHVGIQIIWRSFLRTVKQRRFLASLMVAIIELLASPSRVGTTQDLKYFVFSRHDRARPISSGYTHHRFRGLRKVNGLGLVKLRFHFTLGIRLDSKRLP